jgi:hypothetical protein
MDITLVAEENIDRINFEVVYQNKIFSDEIIDDFINEFIFITNEIISIK